MMKISDHCANKKSSSNLKQRWFKVFSSFDQLGYCDFSLQKSSFFSSMYFFDRDDLTRVLIVFEQRARPPWFDSFLIKPSHHSFQKFFRRRRTLSRFGISKKRTSNHAIAPFRISFLAELRLLKVHLCLLLFL